MTTAAVAFLAFLLPVPEPADTGARVTLITNGASVALSELERSQIASRVEALMVGCAINSVTLPGLFAARSLPKEWEDTRAGSHLYVRFCPDRELAVRSTTQSANRGRKSRAVSTSFADGAFFMCGRCRGMA